MNYVAYKNIDGTITSGFKVKLYDIVTLNTGYWKDKLAIVLYILMKIKNKLKFVLSNVVWI